MIVAQINEDDRTLAQRPKVTSFGLVSDKQDKFLKKLKILLTVFLVKY